MRRILSLLLLLPAVCCCHPEDNPVTTPTGDEYAKGADISWITELESKGSKFYDASGKEKECTELLHSIGFNSVRYRVWVNPKNGWNSKEDVLKKALRAKALGMKIMIDFHYSDSWADPGKQYPPAAWKGHSAVQLAKDVADHTTEVLKYLKDSGIDVTWIQVGNEITNGMLWETCRVKGSEAADFIKVFNSGFNAARAVYPDAKVILHLDNGWKSDTVTWFLDLMGGAFYDMIGFSLYPAYWDDSLGGYPDWRTKTQRFVSCLNLYHEKYKKPMMLCEFGMPASQPEQSRDALQYLLDSTAGLDYFKGIFLWEPEAEKSNTGYDQGAFKNGRPTTALNPFNN